MQYFLFFFFLCLSSLEAVEIHPLVNVLNQGPSPFNYPLDIKIYAGRSLDEDVILCCHGYGGDNSIANVIASYKVIPDHLIGFNFPDNNIFRRKIEPSQITYGTIDEILPAIYLLKKIVVDAQVEKISLYGFSAGGAAVVNIIAALNSFQYENQFLTIGVNGHDVQQILSAIQKGIILLDAPFKSIDEYNAAHPESLKDPIHTAQAKRYIENDMNPINSIAKWQGLKLSVIVFFQNPDAIISNRDDTIFAERLRKVNPGGNNIIISANEGGHLGFHYSLWKDYLKLKTEKLN